MTTQEKYETGLHSYSLGDQPIGFEQSQTPSHKTARLTVNWLITGLGRQVVTILEPSFGRSSGAG